MGVGGWVAKAYTPKIPPGWAGLILVIFQFTFSNVSFSQASAALTPRRRSDTMSNQK
jgi:hypothetical protein